MADVNDLLIRIDSSTEGLRREMRRAEQTVDRSSRKIDRDLERVDKAFAGINAAAVAAKGAMVAFAGAMAMRQIVSATTQMQRIESSFRAATGSAEAGAEAFKFVEAESERLGLSLQSVAAQYSQLLAAAKPTSMTLQDSRDIFSAVAEASTALGLTSEQTAGALNALQQMMSKGTVQAEELRGQLGERIPGAFQIMAQALDVTVQELNKMLQAGEVLAEDALPKIARQLHETFGPQATRAAHNLQQEIHRLHTAFFKLTSSGDVDSLSASIGELSDTLNDPQTRKGLQALVQSLIDITTVGVKAIAMVDELTQKLNKITEWQKAVGEWSPINLGDWLGITDGGLSKLERLQKQKEALNRKITRTADASEMAVLPVEKERQLTKLANLSKAYYEVQAKIRALEKTSGNPIGMPFGDSSRFFTTEAPQNEPAGGSGGGGSTTTQVSALQSAYDDLSASLQKQIALYGDTSDAATLRYRLELGDLAKLSEPRKQHLLSMSQELQLLQKQQQAIETLFPAWQNLERAKNLRAAVGNLPPGMQAFGQKRADQLIADAATQGMPGMNGLDPMYNGAFGEMNRLERERQKYESMYQTRLQSYQIYAQQHKEDVKTAHAAIEALEMQHSKRMLQYDKQIQTAQLKGYSELFGSLAGLTKTFAGEQSDIYRALFAVSKAFTIADSVLHMHSAMMKALDGTFPANLAQLAVVASEGASIMSAIQSVAFTGQAHAGIDSVPREGTWLLDKGERVVDSRTNEDLKQFLAAGAKGGGDVYVTTPVTVEGKPGMSAQEAAQQGQQIGDAVSAQVRKVLVDEKRPGGLLSGAA